MKVAVIIGTCPEAIKMAPVYLALKDNSRTNPFLIVTAQHRQMLDQVLPVFNVEPDIDLDIMRADQNLAELTSIMLVKLKEVLSQIRPDVVLVHGDTTTCLASTLAAFYENIPVGHVEAGLRTYDLQAPWPEEMNRRLVDPICRWCFAPTQRAADNLRAEHVPETNIFITGNTIIDALSMIRKATFKKSINIPGLSMQELERKKIILVTGHRREIFGKQFEEFCFALRDIVRANDSVSIIYPVHLNPNVQKPVNEILGEQDGIHLVKPLEYLKFVYLMERSYLIITDSGGIQEEAPSFGKPVIVTRFVTERPEAVEAGLAKLVGTNRRNIVSEVSKLLNDSDLYTRMTSTTNPYGDGKAADRIVDILCR
jgi:UDP-N-acetylglucosamine 2-epimerase (non-hydrolysing)